MIEKDKKNHDQKLAAFKAKLTAINSFIQIKQALPKTMFLHKQIIDHMNRQRPVYQIDNTLKLEQTEIVIFSQFNAINFQCKNEKLPDNYNYCINFIPSNTYVHVQLVVKGLNNQQNPTGTKKHEYFIKKQQAIVISEKHWEKGIINIKATKMHKLSSLKIRLDSIQTSFKPKANAIPSQRKVAKKIIQDHLRNNYSKAKVQQILKKRRSESMTRLQARSTVYSREKTSKMTSSESQRLIKTAQSKRNFIQFEDTKQKYLKHINKMSPQKGQLIKKYQIDYEKEKAHNALVLSKTICLINFIHVVHRERITKAQKNMQKAKTFLICKQFIKNLVSANKMRMPISGRNRISCSFNISAISSLMYETQYRKCQSRIFEYFRNILFKQSVLKITQLSYKLKKSALKIQKHYKSHCQVKRQWFDILVKLKDKLFQDAKEKDQCFMRYVNYCKQKQKEQYGKKSKIVNLKYIFIVYHKQIDIILRQMRE